MHRPIYFKLFFVITLLLTILRKTSFWTAGFIRFRFSVVLVNEFTVGSFFNYKDELPMRLKSSLVYKFSCAQCASEYVGMTSRTLGARVHEHVGVSYRTGARLTQPPLSAIRDHRDSCGTSFDTSNFKILANASCTSDPRILESLYIYKTKPILNNQLSSYPLSIVN